MSAEAAPRSASTGIFGLGPDHELIDLSVLLAEDLPCHWSTHQPFQVKAFTWFADHRHPAASVLRRNGPYATRWMAIDEHTGSHLDAPSHFIPPPGSGLPDAGPAGSVSVEQIPLQQLIGRCAVVDPNPEAAAEGAGAPEAEPGVSPRITPAAVLAWEERNGELEPGDIVLFRTGWDRHYRRGSDGDRYVYDVVVTGRRSGWPAPDVATIELLLERGIRCVGIDAASMGPADDGRPVHVRALREGMVFIECLTALDRLPERGAWFCFLPLRLEGGTGAPGRAVGFVPRA